MQSSRRDRRIFLALCANAVVLLLILFVLLGRDNRITLASPVFGDSQPTVSGGGGLFVMPGQIGANSWGCYLMDTDHQTLSVYQYSSSEPLLKLVAARSFRYDRLLGDYNTKPSPSEIRELSEQTGQKVQ
jgi:hypothetical protein